jgi:cytochrome c biogenesis protein
MVEYGLLARGEDHRLAAEAQAIRNLLAEEWQLEDSEPTQQTPSRQGHNGPDSVTIPTGAAGPTKDQ